MVDNPAVYRPRIFIPVVTPTVEVGAGDMDMGGQPVTLRLNRILAVGAASMVLNGQPVELTGGLVLEVGAASMALAGRSVNMLRSRHLDVGRASMGIAGSTVWMLNNGRLAVGAASMALNGQSVDMLADEEITVVATAVANDGASTITIPASTAEGDLAILAEYCVGGTGSGPPSGWTQIDYRTEGGTPYRSCISYKVLGSGDPDTAVAGVMPGSFQESAAMVVFRNADALARTISAVQGPVAFDTGDPSAVTIPMGDDTVSGPAIAIGVTQGYSTAASAGMSTNPFDGSVAALGNGGRVGLELGWSIVQSGAASNKTFDMGDAGVNNYPRGFYIT